MADAKPAAAPRFLPASPEKRKTNNVKTTPSRKEGQALVKAVQARVKACTERVEEEIEAVKRGDTHIEDFAWEDELEHSGRRR